MLKKIYNSWWGILFLFLAMAQFIVVFADTGTVSIFKWPTWLIYFMVAHVVLIAMLWIVTRNQFKDKE